MGSEQLVNLLIDALGDYIDARCDYLNDCRKGNEWRTTHEIVRTGNVLDKAIHLLIERTQ